MTTGVVTRGRITEIALHVDDLERAAAFWRGALDQEPERGSESRWISFPLAPGLVLVLLPAHERDADRRERWHLNVSPGSEGQADYVQRLVRLGGQLVGAGASRDGSAVVVTPEGTELVVHRV